MNKTKAFNYHILAICGIFMVGNGIIGLPSYNADQFTIMALLLVLPINIAVFIFSDKVTSLFIKIDVSSLVLKKIFALIFFGFAAIFSAFLGANVFLDFLNFASKVILYETPKFFIALILLLTAIYFALKRQENVLKFALISFVLVSVIIIFFFVASMDKYDLRNVFIFRLPSYKELVFQIKPYLYEICFPLAILPLYLKFIFRENKTFYGSVGILSGGIILVISILTSVLLFGPFFAGRLEFPFNSAVSTVMVGRLFTRLDGFAYFVYFVCYVLKITVCGFVVRSALKRINHLLKLTKT